MSKKNNEIKELSEILATSLSSRPDLHKRLQSMLGPGHQHRDNQPDESLPTMKEAKEIARDTLTRLHLKDQLKKQLS